MTAFSVIPRIVYVFPLLVCPYANIVAAVPQQKDYSSIQIHDNKGTQDITIKGEPLHTIDAHQRRQGHILHSFLIYSVSYTGRTKHFICEQKTNQ